MRCREIEETGAWDLHSSHSSGRKDIVDDSSSSSEPNCSPFALQVMNRKDLESWEDSPYAIPHESRLHDICLKRNPHSEEISLECCQDGHDVRSATEFGRRPECIQVTEGHRYEWRDWIREIHNCMRCALAAFESQPRKFKSPRISKSSKLRQMWLAIKVSKSFFQGGMTRMSNACGSGTKLNLVQRILVPYQDSAAFCQ